MRTINVPKYETINISVSDFSKGLNNETDENIVGINYSTNYYNFDFKSGALTEGIGFKDLKVPVYSTSSLPEHNPTLPLSTNIESIWQYKHFHTTENRRADKLMIKDSSGNLFYSRLFSIDPSFISCMGVALSKKSNTLNFKIGGADCSLMFNDTDGVVVWDNANQPYKLTGIPDITYLCLHKDKLCATSGGQKNIIYFSDNLNLESWGSLTLNQIEMNDERGPINKIISFLGYLYAFRDYGIAKILFANGTNGYTVSQLFVAGNKMYSNTITVCGDEILMLTKDGIYSFDGSSTEKMKLGVNALLTGTLNENAMATYHNGIYYLACRIDFNDNATVGCESENGYKNNVLIAVNVKEKTYKIARGVDISCLTTVQFESMDKVIVCFNKVHTQKLGEIVETGKFFDTNSIKYWESPLSDLGYSNKVKHVREVSLMSDKDCTLTIFNETESKSFNIIGSNVLTKLFVRFKGKQIGFKITTTNDVAHISNLKLKVDLLNYETH